MIKQSLWDIVEDIYLSITDYNGRTEFNLSKQQIVEYIIQARAVIISQKLKYGLPLDNEYTNQLKNINLEPYDMGDKIDGADNECGGVNVNTGIIIKRTSVDLPVVIESENINTMIVTRVNGSPIQLIPQLRFKSILDKKYGKNKPYCWLNEHKLYVFGSQDIGKIHVRGAFEDPRTLEKFGIWDKNAKFPTPINDYPDMKNIIISQIMSFESKKQNLQQAQPQDQQQNQQQ